MSAVGRLQTVALRMNVAVVSGAGQHALYERDSCDMNRITFFFY